MWPGDSCILQPWLYMVAKKTRRQKRNDEHDAGCVLDVLQEPMKNVIP
eukprot:CAMPEP_0195000444 /NCGR_PEP_ID=MMETSP0326_2-20130528/198_1 /TAXON_ID=2866 ORGANISM="Crypthecodinium cohnii, Strain Seligo" /NCGR_SAMPLE_ID=MMETSP0326_2 /ASSEMBLY_ACC=CAM_ASM_000348 /LENGTH=47 /DNA_ID= /DNA_START= /DNA_END= /DNA_ORIENTATION=